VSALSKKINDTPAIRELFPDTKKNLSRREFIQKGISLGAWGGLFFCGGAALNLGARFFYPAVVFHPPSVFEIGKISDFMSEFNPDPYGVIAVDPGFKKLHRFFVIRDQKRIFALFARCTHLGCTVNWFPGIRTFKCPCHGSEFHSNGIQFAGPAPRPLDRLHISLNAAGNILVDTDRVYTEREFEERRIYIEVAA